MKSTVSIVISTFNHAQFLRGSLDSVIGQTFSAWEVNVVNDFSQDNTVELVKAYRDLRIRVVNFANQGVIAASRNQGIALMRAPCIAFLDSDDCWYPKKPQNCLDKLAEGCRCGLSCRKMGGPG